MKNSQRNLIDIGKKEREREYIKNLHSISRAINTKLSLFYININYNRIKNIVNEK